MGKGGDNEASPARCTLRWNKKERQPLVNGALILHLAMSPREPRTTIYDMFSFSPALQQHHHRLPVSALLVSFVQWFNDRLGLKRFRWRFHHMYHGLGGVCTEREEVNVFTIIYLFIPRTAFHGSGSTFCFWDGPQPPPVLKIYLTTYDVI